MLVVRVMFVLWVRRVFGEGGGVVGVAGCVLCLLGGFLGAFRCRGG